MYRLAVAGTTFATPTSKGTSTPDSLREWHTHFLLHPQPAEHPADDQHVIRRQREVLPDRQRNQCVQPVFAARRAWRQCSLREWPQWRGSRGLQELQRFRTVHPPLFPATCVWRSFLCLQAVHRCRYRRLTVQPCFRRSLCHYRWRPANGRRRTTCPEVAGSLSGGGLSNYFERPSYQEEAVSTFLQNLQDHGNQYQDLYKCVCVPDLI